MRIILDTHVFLWSLSAPDKIDREKRLEIESLANVILVSSISVAEILIKVSLGKLKIDFNPVEMAEKSGFEMLEFQAGDALLLRDLPFHHKDPFDRMLIAQGNNRGYPILTDDSKFSLYDCRLI